MNYEETLRSVLVCGCLGHIKELICLYEKGEQPPINTLDEIRKTIEYADEVYKHEREQKEEN